MELGTIEPTSTTADVVKAELPKSAIPPLSPVGRIVRRVLVWASYLVPVVWVVAIGVLISSRTIGTMNLWAKLFAGIGVFHLPAVLVGWLFYVAVFRLRARLLELLLVLSAVSLLPGMFFSGEPASESGAKLVSQLGEFAMLLCVSACFVGGGAVWGLSVSQRTGEERTWPRLGYIALGCAMLTGFVATAPFVIALIWVTVNSIYYWGGGNDWKTPLIFLGITIPLVVAAVWGLSIEFRCRKKHGPVNL